MLKDMDKQKAAPSVPWLPAIGVVIGVLMLANAAEGGPFIGILGLVMTVAGAVRFVTGAIDYAKAPRAD